MKCNYFGHTIPSRLTDYKKELSGTSHSGYQEGEGPQNKLLPHESEYHRVLYLQLKGRFLFGALLCTRMCIKGGKVKSIKRSRNNGRLAINNFHFIRHLKRKFKTITVKNNNVKSMGDKREREEKNTGTEKV